MDPALLQSIAIQALPLLFAITIHEVAHGWVAGKLGDPTARMMGRITLNPIAHIDPLGTIILPLLQMFAQTGTLFGWAKPVPVNFANLRRLRRDSILVAFAGPGSNLIQFLLWMGVLLVIGLSVGLPAGFPASVFAFHVHLDLSGASGIERVTAPIAYMAQAGLRWNAWLAVLNLVPILPLDGGRILNALLPPAVADKYARLEPFGILFLFGFLYLFGQLLIYPLLPLELLLRLVFGG